MRERTHLNAHRSADLTAALEAGRLRRRPLAPALRAASVDRR